LCLTRIRDVIRYLSRLARFVARVNLPPPCGTSLLRL
jgi:hypothetical protein